MTGFEDLIAKRRFSSDEKAVLKEGVPWAFDYLTRMLGKEVAESFVEPLLPVIAKANLSDLSTILVSVVDAQQKDGEPLHVIKTACALYESSRHPSGPGPFAKIPEAPPPGIGRKFERTNPRAVPEPPVDLRSDVPLAALADGVKRIPPSTYMGPVDIPGIPFPRPDLEAYARAQELIEDPLPEIEQGYATQQTQILAAGPGFAAATAETVIGRPEDIAARLAASRTLELVVVEKNVDFSEDESEPFVEKTAPRRMLTEEGRVFREELYRFVHSGLLQSPQRISLVTEADASLLAEYLYGFSEGKDSYQSLLPFQRREEVGRFILSALELAVTHHADVLDEGQARSLVRDLIVDWAYSPKLFEGVNSQEEIDRRVDAAYSFEPESPGCEVRRLIVQRYLAPDQIKDEIQDGNEEHAKIPLPESPRDASSQRTLTAPGEIFSTAIRTLESVLLKDGHITEEIFDPVGVQRVAEFLHGYEDESGNYHSSLLLPSLEEKAANSVLQAVEIVYKTYGRRLTDPIHAISMARDILNWAAPENLYRGREAESVPVEERRRLTKDHFNFGKEGSTGQRQLASIIMSYISVPVAPQQVGPRHPNYAEGLDLTPPRLIEVSENDAITEEGQRGLPIVRGVPSISGEQAAPIVAVEPLVLGSSESGESPLTPVQLPVVQDLLVELSREERTNTRGGDAHERETNQDNIQTKGRGGIKMTQTPPNNRSQQPRAKQAPPKVEVGDLNVPDVPRETLGQRATRYAETVVTTAVHLYDRTAPTIRAAHNYANSHRRTAATVGVAATGLSTLLVGFGVYLGRNVFAPTTHVDGREHTLETLSAEHVGYKRASEGEISTLKDEVLSKGEGLAKAQKESRRLETRVTSLETAYNGSWREQVLTSLNDPQATVRVVDEYIRASGGDLAVAAENVDVAYHHLFNLMVGAERTYGSERSAFVANLKNQNFGQEAPDRQRAGWLFHVEN